MPEDAIGFINKEMLHVVLSIDGGKAFTTMPGRP
jgi:hypothetical protein